MLVAYIDVVKKKRGFFITFEGIDGSGKTTQARRLERYLRRKGLKVIFVREPGSTMVAEKLRQIVLKTTAEKISAAAELFIFLASRAQIVENVIRPALQKGAVVICQRFSDSTTAYQSFGRGWNRWLIEKLNQVAANYTVPNLTFFIDVPVSVGLRRVQRKPTRKDRMEMLPRNFHLKVRSGYLRLVKEEPQRFVLLDGIGSPDAVWQQIKKIVDRKLK